MGQKSSAIGSTVSREAEVFGAYILKRKPADEIINRYAHILQNRQLSASPSAEDRQLIDFSLRHPWSLGMLDSYLAFFKPSSELRHRVYIMVAVLESSPHYVDYFLPVKRNPFYLFYIAFAGMRATVKIPFGFAVSLVARVA